jgi:hypothetical protein
MITRRLLHFLLAVAFFAAAIAAGMQMQNTIGENIATGFGNLFRQLSCARFGHAAPDGACLSFDDPRRAIDMALLSELARL